MINDEDKKLQVLLRVAIELFYRSENLKNYLDQINQENRKDYKRLIQTIQNSINGIEGIIFQNLEYLPIFQENTDQEKQNINDLLYSNLGKFSKWFTTLHELLLEESRTSRPDQMRQFQPRFASTLVR